MRRKTKDILFVVVVILCISFILSFSMKTLGSVKPNLDKKDPVVDDTKPDDTTNEFEGKTISFLGDSITTYEGISNDSNVFVGLGENYCYYTPEKMQVDDTYWKRVINELGLTLCVNNSADAGRVTDTKEGVRSGVERAPYLHPDNINIKPDIIIVYIGTNDFANGILAPEFHDAYSEMLGVIKNQYPEAEVYCCTLLPESRLTNNDLETAHAIITSSATYHGFNVIDFYSELPDWDYTKHTFVDGDLRVHPNVEGMSMLADCIIKNLKNS